MDRSDIFISYRRKNIEFAQKLDAALRQEGFEVWIDLEDIAPASPEYDKDIEKGIEGADIFIPILSPDFFESEFCKKELQLAANNNKRIIPVIYEKGFDASIELMPDYTQKVNWVYFCPHLTETNEFDSAFPKLLTGIRLNHEYARLHTNYLTLAKTWDENARNESYLLSGEALSAAEMWLATEVIIEPYPNALQRQFISSSRKLEIKRLELENARLEKEKELERTAAHRQRNFISLFFVVLLIAAIWMLFTATQMENIARTALQNYLKTSLNIGLNYVIDSETMQEVIETDGASAESVSAHQQQLDMLRTLYPNVISYSVDNQGDLIAIGRNSEIEEDNPQITVPLDSMESSDGDIVGTNPYFYHYYDGDNRWIVAWTDIVDSQGTYLGQLVMEYPDPRSEAENSLLVALGFLLIFTVMSIIIYVLIVMWHRIQNWFTKSDSISDTRAEVVNSG